MAEYVTKIQQHKQEAIQALKETIESESDLIFADYRGLSVEQITDLRGRLRASGARFKVVKNRFAKIALRELDYPDVSEYLIGPTAVALSGDEAGPVAKVLVEFAADTTVSLKGAIIDGNVLAPDEVVEFSKLPTRSDLISQLMSAMNGSLMNLMNVMNAVPTKLVRTLMAVAEKLDSE